MDVRAILFPDSASTGWEGGCSGGGVGTVVAQDWASMQGSGLIVDVPAKVLVVVLVLLVMLVPW